MSEIRDSLEMCDRCGFTPHFHSRRLASSSALGVDVRPSAFVSPPTTKVAPMAPFLLWLCLLYLPFEELYEVDGRCGSVARSETPFGGTYR